MIMGQLGHGVSVEEVLEGYSDLKSEDVRHALGYAAWCHARSDQRGAALERERAHVGPLSFEYTQLLSSEL